VSVLLSPVQWLIDFLVCLAKFAVGLLLAGVMLLVNLIVAGLMLLLGPLLALLPQLDLGSVQAPSFIAWANWALPLDQLVIAVGLVVTVLVAWHVAAIGLRWLKVVE
jgi:hypothetical protein